MSFILVSYDLHAGTSDDYAEFFEVLKSYPGWWHYLESTWILSTDDSPSQVMRRLKGYIGDEDRVLVVSLGDDPKRQGWLPQKAWEWFHRHEDE